MHKLNILSLFIILAFVAACGESYEAKQKITKEERAKEKRADSLALKIGVRQTLDCLPLFVAKEEGIFDSLKVDVRLKTYNGRIDSDDALKKGKIEGCVTDLVRTENLKKQGVELEYTTATNAYWQFISNRKARIKNMKQMTDKMFAMARFSASDMLGDIAVDSVKLQTEAVFRVQINDMNLRLKMIQNNEMDAAVLTEPQATTARLYKNPVLMDSRKKDLNLGVIAFRAKDIKDKRRNEQMEAFIKAYNEAVDRINKKGLKGYGDIIIKYTKTDKQTVNALPQMKYEHTTAPREKDIECAAKWIRK